MEQVSVAELRKDIGHYLDRVAKGEEITVTKRGKVVAVLSSKKPKIDLGDMDEFYDTYDVFDDTNAVVEARKEYRY